MISNGYFSLKVGRLCSWVYVVYVCIVFLRNRFVGVVEGIYATSPDDAV